MLVRMKLFLEFQ